MYRLSILLCGILAFSCKSRTGSNISVDYTNHEHWDEWRLYTNDGASLFVREFGKGDTVTVLHGGWGAEHSYLIDALAPYADQYHFIFYDQRGSLRSQCADSVISVKNHIEDLERIRKSTGQQKLLLLGHSMGGFLGMSYLEKYPDKVSRLVLIASPPARGNVKQLTEDIQGPALKRWERPEVTDTLKAHGLNISDWGTYKGRRNGMMHRITFAALNMHDVKHWKKLQGAFYWHGKSSEIAAKSGPQEWDFTDNMKQSQCRIMVIHGDDDYLPLDYHKTWVPDVPDATLKIIKDAGHLCWIDQPEAFGNALLESLK